MSAIIAEIIPVGFDKLVKDTQSASKSMTDLDTTLQKAQKTLDGLDKNSQAFKDLTKEVQAATLASETYSKSNESLKREYRATVDEVGKLQRALNELDKAGLKNSQTYKDIAKEQDNLKKKSGELKDEIGDLNKEIATSGSDTKNLDKTLRAVNTVAAGYQAAQGALVLFGGENKKFEETLLKLNAVMAVTQGLQQIQEELSKKDSIFTMAAAKAKQLYALATETATGAVSAFGVALTSLGIGAVIIAIGFLVANWDRLKVAIFGATDALEKLIESKRKQLELSKESLKDLEIELEYQKAINGLSDIKAQEQKIAKVKEQQKLNKDIYDAQVAQQAKIEKKAKEYDEVVDFRTGKLVKYHKANQFQIDEQIAKVKEADKAYKLSTISVYEEEKKLIEIKKKAQEKTKINKKESDKEEIKDNYIKNDKNLAAYIKGLNDQNKAYRKYLTEKAKLNAENIQKLKEQAGDENKIAQERLDDLLRRNKENSDKIVGLKFDENVAKQQAYLDDENKQKENQQRNFTLANELGQGLFSIAKSISEAKLAILDDELSRGVITNKKYQAEVRKIKRKEAIAAKAEAAFNIGLSIAEGIAKAFAKGAGPVGIALGAITAAVGAAQLAMVLAKPIPAFRHGGVVKEHGLLKGRSHEQGGTIVEAEMDEYFMPTKQTKKYINHLEAMRKGNYDDFIQKEQFGYLKQSLFKNHFSSIPRTDMIPKFERKDRSADSLEKLLDEVWQMKHAIKNMDRNNMHGLDRTVYAVIQSKQNSNV